MAVALSIVAMMAMVIIPVTMMAVGRTKIFALAATD
jgi:hypothetical protein